MATVTVGDGSNCCWMYECIVLAEVPVELFPFLFVKVMNGVTAMIMLVAAVSGFCGRGRKSGLHQAECHGGWCCLHRLAVELVI